MSENVQIVEHRVNHGNRALQFIAGVVGIFLIWKAWQAEWAYAWGFDIFNRPSPEVGDGFGSITGAGSIIVLLIDAVCLLGMALLFFVTGLWSGVKELVSSLQGFVSVGRDKLDGGKVATQEVKVTAKVATPESKKITSWSQLSPGKTVSALNSLKARVEKLEAKVAPEPLPEEPSAELDRVGQVEKAVEDIVAKVDALVDAMAKPAPKTASRRKPAGSAK